MIVSGEITGGPGGTGGGSDLNERVLRVEIGLEQVCSRLDNLSAKIDTLIKDNAETKGELRGKPGHMQIFAIVTFALALVGFAARFGPQILGAAQ